jgi:biotin transport system substrate-specific component
MVMYLAMGAAGLPVFTPGGLPGPARVVGPTGGYLIAYPFAAALTGWVAGAVRRPSWPRALGATLAGMAALHLGGLAQLLVLTGSLERAVASGTLPFVAADLAKAALAALVLRRGLPRARALG